MVVIHVPKTTFFSPVTIQFTSQHDGRHLKKIRPSPTTFKNTANIFLTSINLRIPTNDFVSSLEGLISISPHSKSSGNQVKISLKILSASKQREILTYVTTNE